MVQDARPWAGAASLPELLRLAAEAHPRQEIVHVSPGGLERAQSYRELYEGAVAVAAALEERRLRAGTPLLLALERSEHFLPCFWGALLAGLVPAPLAREPERIRAVWQHLDAPALLCDTALRRQLEELPHAGPAARFAAELAQDVELLLCTTGRSCTDLEPRPATRHGAAPEAVAYLQFSSGSTGDPRGVELTHACLLANIGQIVTSCLFDPADVLVTWMPYFHDMGLVAAHLAPLAAGVRQIKLDPLHFARRPTIWLEQAHRHRATLLAAAPFALSLVVERVAPAQIAALDLRQVRMLAVGAEPVPPAVCRAFLEHAAPSGLPPEVLIPVYGLAEASVGVTMSPLGGGLRAHRLDHALLTREGRAVEAGPAAQAVELADVGAPLAGCAVRIVDERDRTLPERQVGHIQVRGPQVMRGYHGVAPSGQPFCAGWLRTGDMGYLTGGRLVISGRDKDVVICNGRNYHALDLEALVRSVEGLVPSHLAICGSSSGDGAERVLVFIAERGPGGRREGADSANRLGLLEEARRRLRRATGAEVEIIPLAARRFPRTTSGKIQRYRLRARYEAGELTALASPSAHPAPISNHAESEHARQEQDTGLEANSGTPEQLALEPDLSELRHLCAGALGLAPDALGLDESFLELGATSLQLMTLLARVGDRYGHEPDPAALRERPTVAGLAQWLRHARAVAPAAGQNQHARQADPAAVISLACRFPGAESPEQFWEALVQGVDSVRPLPSARRDGSPSPEPGSQAWGSLLDEVARFDAAFFGIPDEEAAMMDPQQRLLLELAYEALERAGYAGRRRIGRRVGVFIGVGEPGYQELVLRLLEAGVELPASTAVGAMRNLAAARIAHALDLVGPAIAVDTACSSALVALHLARASLERGECDLALVGGANLNLTSTPYRLLSRAGALSPTGRSRAFDDTADGFVPGEGAAIVLLEPRELARRHGDTMLGLVRGSAVNNDGRALSPMAPNPLRQVEVLHLAYRDAGVAPESISYVEAHGTGTAIGDPIEARSIAQVFPMPPTGEQRALGSVKTNLGHLLNAAGMPALIKVLLMLRHRQLPPSLHYGTPSKRFDLAGAGLTVNTTPQPWLGPAPLRAGVNSFGFGGTNAHVILEEAPDEQPETRAESQAPYHLLALSARTPEALRELAARWAEHLRRHPDTRAGDLCASAAEREQREERAALVLSGLAPAEEEIGRARAALEALARGAKAEARANAGAADLELARGIAPPLRQRKVAFMFAGQGAQYPGQGRALYETAPAFRASFEAASLHVGPLDGRTLVEWCFDADVPAASLARTAITQPLLVAFEVALARLAQSWGLSPDAVVGHSVGEIAAACVAGALSLEQALDLAARRGRLMEELGGAGAMAAVFAPEALVREQVEADPRRLAIAALNAPGQVVLSGAREAVEQALERLAWAGYSAVPINQEHAFHSPLMEPVVEPIAAAGGMLQHGQLTLPLLSTVSAGWVGAKELDARYWAEQLRQPVLFAPAIARLVEEGYDTFVEIGPGTTLAALARQIVPANTGGTAEALLRRGADDGRCAREALARLWVRGVTLDVATGAGEPQRRVALPGYPFERRPHWLPPLPPRMAPEPEPGLGGDELLHELVWTPAPLRPTSQERLRNLILVADAGLALGPALAVRLRDAGQHVVQLVPGRIDQLAPPADGQPYGLVVLAACADEPAPASLADLERQQQRALRLLEVLHRLANLPAQARPAWLWVVTAEACATGAARERPTPAHALAAGLARAFQDELPALPCLHLDLSAADTPETQAAQLELELWVRGGTGTLAWRGGERLAPSARPARPGASRTSALAGGAGTVLVVGGAGALGSAISRHLVGRGHSPLVLVGRAPLDERRAALLEELRGLGSDAYYRMADITDEWQVERLVAEVLASHGAIEGLIHAAGSVDPGSIMAKGWERVEATLAPKVRGTWLLAQALRRHGQRPAFQVLCSSIASALPGLGGGLADYVAANAYQDLFAAVERQAGRAVTAICWGPWEESGMAASGPLLERLARRGCPPLSNAHAMLALDRALALGRPQVIAGYRGGLSTDFENGLNHPQAGTRSGDGSGLLSTDFENGLIHPQTGTRSGDGSGLCAGEGGSPAAARNDDHDDNYGSNEPGTTVPLAHEALPSHAGGGVARRAGVRVPPHESPPTGGAGAHSAGLSLPPTMPLPHEPPPPRIGGVARSAGGRASDALERGLQRLVAEALKRPASGVPVDVPFLTLGLDSLHAVDLVRRLERLAGRELPLTLFFELQTIRELAAYLAEHAPQLGPALEAAEEQVPREPGQAQDNVIQPAREQDAPFPLAPAQLAFYIGQQLYPDRPAFALVRQTIAGPLEPALLQATCAELVERHPMLRVVFGVDQQGQPSQRVLPAAQLSSDSWFELRSDAAADALEQELAGWRFDLKAGPLFRVVLCASGAGAWELFLLLHHIIADGWSVGVLLEELWQRYTLRSAGLHAPEEQPGCSFVDYVAACAAEAASPRAAEDQRWWAAELAAHPTTGAWMLPGEAAAGEEEGVSPTQVQRAELGRHESELLRERAAAAGVSLFHLLLAAYAQTLGEWSASAGVAINVADHGRAVRLPGVERLVGSCADQLPLLLDLRPGESVLELAARVRDRWLGVQQHRRVSSLDLARLQRRRGVGLRSPGAATFSLARFPGTAPQACPVAVEAISARAGSAATRLTLLAYELDGALQWCWIYPRGAYRQETIARLAERYRAALLAGPETVGSAAQDEPLAAEHSLELVPARILEQCRRAPGAVAVRFAGRELSYGDLERQSGLLAGRLVQEGARPNQPVALLTLPGSTTIVGIVGVLRAGAPWLPLNSEYPTHQLASMARQAHVRLLLYQAETAEAARRLQAELMTPLTLLPLDDGTLDEARAEATPAATRDATIQPDDTAYVIFTSGSTGAPKGVPIAHRAIANYVGWLVDTFGYGPHDRLLQTAAISFGASISQILGPLCAGGTIIPAPVATVRDPEELLELVERERPTIWRSVPSLWERLLAVIERRVAAGLEPPQLDQLRWIGVGGEALPASLVRRWMDLYGERQHIANHYGPSEATINATCYLVEGRPPAELARLPIGRPIRGTRARVLDERGGLAPAGEVGELCIGGVCLSPGYLGRPDLTAERFMDDPWAPGERLYRTGDLVRELPDGNLEFVGRADDQVKIRGFRVEPGEIEAALYQHPAIAQVAVCPATTDDGETELVAYLELNDELPAPAELRRWLRQLLPPYMIPHRFQPMPTLPKTPSGKIDRRQLRELAGGALGATAGAAGAGLTPTESLLAEAWREVLRVPAVGRDDDFFELGGDSLRMLQVFARLEGRLPVRPRAALIYQHSRLADLARVVDEAGSAGASTRAVTSDPALATRDVPLTPAQAGFLLLHAIAPHAQTTWATRLDLAGPLDRAALQHSLTALVARHQLLRVTFRADERPPRQVEEPRANTITISFEQPSAGEDAAGLVERRWQEERRRSFDLQRWPLLQLAVVSATPLEHTLIISAHHLIGDGWSAWIFGQELLQLYDRCRQGAPAALPALRTSPADYAAALERQQRESAAEDSAYWRAVFATPYHPPSGWEGGEPKPASGGEPKPALALTLDPALTARLQQAARAYGLTLSVALFGLFARQLLALTAAADLVLGAAVAGRDLPLPDVERLFGCFATVLPVRLRGVGAELPSALRQVADAYIAASLHALAPGQIMRLAPAETRPLAGAGTQFLFTYVDFAALGPLASETLAVRWDDASSEVQLPATGTDLLLTVRPVEGELRLRLQSSAALSQQQLEAFAAGLLAQARELAGHRPLASGNRQPPMPSAQGLAGAEGSSGAAPTAARGHGDGEQQPARSAGLRRASSASDKPIFVDGPLTRERQGPLDAALVGYLPGRAQLGRLLGLGQDEERLGEALRALLFPRGDPTWIELLETPQGRSGFICLPWFADELTPERARELGEAIKAGIERAEELGARVVSLAGMLPALTGYGLGTLQHRAGVAALTTGHATTAVAVVRNLEAALLALGRPLERCRLAVVGLGSIGQAALTLLLSRMPHPRGLVLCERRGSAEGLRQLVIGLQDRLGFAGEIAVVEADGAVPAEVYAAQVIVGAASTPNIVEVARLQPGTLVVDDSFPHCLDPGQAIARMRERRDVLIVGGGMLAGPGVRRTIALPVSDARARRVLSAHMIPGAVASCQLESLLRAADSSLPPTLGLVRVEAAHRYWAASDAAGWVAAPLHLRDFLVDEQLIELVRQR